MQKIIHGIIALLFLVSTAHAGGHGGYSTKFDPNFFPGATISCALSLASGECGAGPFAAYYDMACDGTTDDRTGKANFVAAAAGANPARALIYVPPGHYCRFFGDGAGLNYNGNVFTGTTAANVIWWGYGSRIDLMQLGGSALYQDSIPSGLINTVSAGSTTLVVNDGNEANFNAGDWIMVSGVCGTHSGGYPPVFQFFEQQMVTNRSGATITIGQPLAHDYKSTWPACSFSSGNGGQAAIYKYADTWKSNIQVYGLTFTQYNGAQGNIVNQTAALYDVTVAIGSTAGPSSNKSAFFFNLIAYSGLEIDKQIDLLYFYRSNIGLSGVQSPSPTNLIYDSSSLFCGTGTAVHSQFRNVQVYTGGCSGAIIVGPFGSGPGISAVFDNVTFPEVRNSDLEIKVSDTTFAAGAFKVSKGINFEDFFRVFQIGAKYKFAGHNAGLSSCTPLTTFTVLGLREDASFYYADTDIVGALPAPDCSYTLIPTYTAYPALTIQQINGPAGQPDITLYAAP